MLITWKRDTKNKLGEMEGRLVNTQLKWKCFLVVANDVFLFFFFFALGTINLFFNYYYYFLMLFYCTLSRQLADGVVLTIILHQTRRVAWSFFQVRTSTYDLET